MISSLTSGSGLPANRSGRRALTTPAYLSRERHLTPTLSERWAMRTVRTVENRSIDRVPLSLPILHPPKSPLALTPERQSDDFVHAASSRLISESRTILYFPRFGSLGR